MHYWAFNHKDWLYNCRLYDVRGKYAYVAMLALFMDRVLEIKSPWKNPRESERWVQAEQGKWTEADYAQVQHQLYVTEARAADLVIWDWTSEEGLVIEILPDLAYWQVIWRVWNRYEKELSECTIRL